MDGKIFLEVQLPPPISDFVFDLQRFEATTITSLQNIASNSDSKKTDAYYLNAGEYEIKSGTITLDKPIIVTGTVTLNLNGKYPKLVLIQDDTNASSAFSEVGALIGVQGSGSLTIIGINYSKNQITANSTTAIKLINDNDDDTMPSLTLEGGLTVNGNATGNAVLVEDGSLTINASGTNYPIIINSNNAGTSILINGENTTAEINAGSIGNDRNTNAVQITKAKEVIFKGGEFKKPVVIEDDAKSVVSFEGGTFYSEITASDGKVYSLNFDGSTKWYGSADVHQAAIDSAVASIGEGDNIRYYSTFYQAFNGANDGETIKFLTDIATNDSQDKIVENKSITLDLNGKNIKLNYSNYNKPIRVKTGGILTVIDSSEEKTGTLANGAIVIRAEGGTVNLNGGTISRTSAGNYNYAVYAGDTSNNDLGGTVNVNGATISPASGVTPIYMESKSKVVVTSGEIVATGDNVYAIGGKEGATDTSVSISGGEISSESEDMIYDSSTGEESSIVISGGTFNQEIDSKYIAADYTEIKDEDGNSYIVPSDSAEGWNSSGTAQWVYTAKDNEDLKVVANLTGSGETLKLLTSGSTGTTVPLDVGNVISNNTTYKTLDASGVTNAGFVLNITGDSLISAITGGAGNDTLTAGANGASLDGGAGNDYLKGGKGADTFVYTTGSDTIESYTTLDAVNVAQSLTPATSFDKVSYNGSDYIVSLGGGTTDSLTFKATNTFALTNGANVYSYTPTEISKNGTSITLGPDHANRFNGTLDAYSTYETIDASAVTKAIRITGNDKANLITGGTGGGVILGGNENDTLIAGGGKTTLNGGDGADSLVGSASGADTFIYTGGTDSISGYGDGDLVSVASAFKPADATFSVGADNNISLTFDDNNKLIFEGVGDTAVSLKSGRTTFAYTKNYIATADGITLAAGYDSDFDGTNSVNSNYVTINAAAVSLDTGISITGNDKGNYIVGSTVQGSSLYGGAGNDTLVGNANAADVFRYDSGKDVIIGFNGAADSLSIDTPETTIAKARASSRRLTFTMTDKSNTLVFRSDDSIPAQISLDGGGYLTKDGVVKGDDLKLFSSAKGRIDLNDTLYSAASIDAVDASTVKSQSVTLVGGSQGGAFTFATDGNKKRDGFEYGGGAVSISNYESGKDRINLLNESIAGFSIVGDETTGNDVVISLSSSDSSKFISLKGAQGSEVLIHQSTNKGNSYSKMVFADTGVLYDKAKATSATLSTDAEDFAVESTEVKSTLRKIIVGAGAQGIIITAGNSKNTQIDASNASGAVSLVSGAKNDKFTGSSNADTFIYTAGKDIIQNFNIGDVTDQISLSGGDELKLEDAKITAGKKSIKFKFEGGSKNTLTIKPTKGDTLSGELTINNATRTYGKNSIADSSGNVTLTSKFGGTYNVSKSGGSTIDGGLVSKKLTFKGTDAAESLLGGSGKTMFKGGGGNDTLQGGSGADTFFYAKGDKGSVTIADFDFDNDKLKIAGGTLAKVSVVSGNVQFAMKEGRGESPEVGWFNLTSFKKDNADATASNVLIKTNNTYYWFADGNETLASSTDESLQTAKVGALITSTSKISSSQTKGYDIIELNYSTNLVKSNVAVQVKDTLKAQS